jgi:hypothetical protein
MWNKTGTIIFVKAGREGGKQHLNIFSHKCNTLLKFFMYAKIQSLKKKIHG